MASDMVKLGGALVIALSMPAFKRTLHPFSSHLETRRQRLAASQGRVWVAVPAARNQSDSVSDTLLSAPGLKGPVVRAAAASRRQQLVQMRIIRDLLGHARWGRACTRGGPDVPPHVVDASFHHFYYLSIIKTVFIPFSLLQPGMPRESIGARRPRFP